MKINSLTLKDRKLFAGYLGLARQELSAYSFVNIYIWKELFEISWAVVRHSLCVFFRDKIGTFMYLPPLAKEINPAALEECFSFMDSRNKNREVSRIENIHARDIQEYKKLGYEVYQKPGEYLYKIKSLAELKGRPYKSKRACANYFLKNYKFEYRPYAGKDKAACLRLYDCWAGERKKQNTDPLYQWMLQDSKKSLLAALKDYPSLGLEGKVVKIAGKLQAFTLGFPLNADTFCVIYEITNLKYRGLAQFIFMRFCRDLGQYKFINAMDDSGLENLKRVKLSYRPAKVVPAYICRRNA